MSGSTKGEPYPAKMGARGTKALELYLKKEDGKRIFLYFSACQLNTSKPSPNTSQHESSKHRACLFRTRAAVEPRQ